MNILVTGGAGFIGSHIVDALVDLGHRVSIIDNLSHGKKVNLNKKAKFYYFDIRDTGIEKVFAEEKPEIVFHEAAQIKVPKSIEDPMEDAEINIMGTLNILENCRKFKVRKIIYPASAAIFGEPQYLPIDEVHPLEMLSGYGVTKHTVEHYLKVYEALYEISYVVLRYANVYGPRQDSTGEGGVISIFSEKILNGQTPVIFGDGEHTRDFVFVKDIARANLLAMNSMQSNIYNVGTNSSISLNELVKIFGFLLGKEIKPIYSKERKGDIRHCYLTYSKIKNDLNWEPEYDLISGLKETLEYYSKESNSLTNFYGNTFTAHM